MIPHRRKIPRPRGLALLLIGLLALTTVAVPAVGQPPTRKQEIAELEKQLANLKKKLAELKKAPEEAPAPTASGTLPNGWTKALTWRPIGPASMGGRITDISVFEADPTTYFVATASGGLLKTINNGVTFEHQFDREATVSLGAVCVAPSDRNIVWVGTGENNPRNSVSYGDGVYKSTDGGRTWKHMGLKNSFQTGKIVIHPSDPNIVYVGALGRLYGPNEERGLYKTTNGGVTWDRVHYVDDKTGVIDMVMHPTEPNTLLVATWERQRDEFDSHRGEPLKDGYDAYDPVKKWGPGSGIWKTTDGGKSFQKLTKGLPSSNLGRVGLDYYRKNPSTIFAIIDCEKIGMGRGAQSQVFLGIQGETDKAGGVRLSQVTENSPAAKAGLKSGDVILAIDKTEIKDYERVADPIRDKKAGEKVTIRFRRDKETKEVALTLENRPGAGKGGGPGKGGGSPGVIGGAAARPNTYMYGGQQPNIQDRQGPDGHEYGGIYKSTDGGETWTRVNSLNPRPMYFSVIRVDPSDEKHIWVCGVQFHKSSDGGKTFTADGGPGVHPDHHALWISPRDGRHMIVGCDGGFYVTYDRGATWDYLNHLAIGQFYHVALDNRKPYWVYGGLQDNGSWGGPSMSLKGAGPINEDYIFVQGGDGFVCRVDPTDPDLVYFESQDGNMGRRNLRTGERGFIRPRGTGGAAAYRFNWNTPFILSSHNPRIYYCAGNHVFRSVNRGDDLRVISPEITRTKRGSGTAVAESPRNPDVLWVGTDDGALWVTRDGGKAWKNVADAVGLPGPRWVATIEPSRFSEGRCYVAFDGHRSNDDEPHVYMTEDYGATWRSLRANLPWGSTRVLREDLENQNLLFVGTEFAVFASLNRGASWTKINNNLPTVAVHELALHPTAGEMVAATHGRSLWVLDVSALRSMSADTVKAKAHLYRPNTGTQWRSEPGRFSPYGSGARRFMGQNPPRGVQLYFSLNQKAEKASLKVLDYAGQTVRQMTVPTEPGLHALNWDLTRVSLRPTVETGEGPPPKAPQKGGRGGRPGGGTGGPPVRFGQAVTPGMYRVVLTVDGQEFTQGIRVDADPTLPAMLAAPPEPE